MQVFDKTFPANYECEVRDELPASGNVPVRYFPPGRRAGQDGTIIVVRSKVGEPFAGVFAFGDRGVSRVLSMPKADRLCVVARGTGYVVSVDDPEHWERIPVIPVLDVRIVGELGLVVFADHTKLVGYDATGLRWKTARLSWDGLRIVEVSASRVIGEYWDIRDEATKRFDVDLETGKACGGVE
jgi:hypothetical protein